MAIAGKTWWGRRFLAALEQCTEPGRLQRGRRYATLERLLTFEVENELVRATVLGNVNPYFGVHTAPRYEVSIALAPIPATHWRATLKRLTGHTGWLSRLAMDEMPDDIEAAFKETGHALLPRHAKDLATQCSCPDHANPCKHVAGVYYRLARTLDRDPLLLFQLRGLPRDRLHTALAKTPLGQGLLEQRELEQCMELPAVRKNRYTVPDTYPLEALPTPGTFWHGEAWPEETDTAQATVPALLIKKAGDYPAFWDKDTSFIETMEALYEQVVRKNRERL